VSLFSFCVVDCIGDFYVPQPAERRIGDKIDAAFIFARADFVNVRWLHRMLGVDCHFGADVEEGFTLALLIMRNRGLFSCRSGAVPALGFWLFSVPHAS
jgi:hypothetical protein